MSNYKNLHNARKEKNDEFYTRYQDIADIVKIYAEDLRDKIIYMNCDNPRVSNFWRYFVENYEAIGPKYIVSTYYAGEEGAVKTVYDGRAETQEFIDGDGSFDSPDCLDILRQSDVIITNPPFSLFRRFFDVIKDKDFIVVAHQTVGSYKDVFPYFAQNKIRASNQKIGFFTTPNGEVKHIPAIWITTFAREEKPFLHPSKRYTPDKNQMEDRGLYLNVDRLEYIPDDYAGLMAVPITIIKKYNPAQYQLIKMNDKIFVKGKHKFRRFIIKNIAL